MRNYISFDSSPPPQQNLALCEIYYTGFLCVIDELGKSIHTQVFIKGISVPLKRNDVFSPKGT